MDYRLIGKKEAVRLSGQSDSTLKNLRLNGNLTEGVEWVRQNSRSVLYNAQLLLSFFQNRNDSAAHQRNIAAYFASLNQPKARGRRAS
jgi:hypothetical protein